MTRYAGLTGSVKIDGSTVANIRGWTYNPAPEWGNHAGATDTSESIKLVDTRFTGSFNVERNDSNSAQSSLSDTPSAVTLILDNGPDSFTLSVYAWQMPSYQQGDAVLMMYRFRDR